MKINSSTNHDFQMNNQSEKESSPPQGQRIKYTRDELMTIRGTSATKAAVQSIMLRIKDAPCLKQNEDKDKPTWAPGYLQTNRAPFPSQDAAGRCRFRHLCLKANLHRFAMLLN